MKIYIAEFRYGSENIAELEVQERDKTYKVISKKDIIGRCWDRLIKKDDESVCLTLQEAFFKIEAWAKKAMELQRQEYETALEKYNVIHEVTSAIRLDPTKLDRALKELQDPK